MHSNYRRGDVLGMALILSFFVSLFILTQSARSEDGALWASASAINTGLTAEVPVEEFNTAPTIPCSDQEFAWKARGGGWINPIVTTEYTQCAVSMADAYFETGSTTQGRIRSFSSDKTLGVEFPELTNTRVFAVPNSHTIAVNSWAYQNYYGQQAGLHIIKDYRLTLTESRLDGEGNKIIRSGKAFDFELRGPDERLVSIRPGGIKFSQDGKWMLFKHSYGGQLTWARLNLETYEVLSFATPVQDYYAVHNAISNDGRYVAIYEPMSSLRVYDLDRCSAGSDKLVSKGCAYTEMYDYLKHKLGVSEIQFRNFEFRGDRSLSVYIGSKKASEPTWKYGEYLLHYGDEVTTNGYLAMGDSFSSGEGAYDYRTETDFYRTSSEHNLCHQSRSSYPYILNQTIGFEWFGSVACSGAKVKDIAFRSPDPGAYQRDDPQARSLSLDDTDDIDIYSSFLPGYREQKNFLKIEDKKPQAVTLTITGNDIGFGDIVESCVNPLKSFVNCYHDRNKREALANLIDDQVEPLSKLLEDIKQQADHPNFRLYVIGYPQIVSTSGVCGLNVGMTDYERDFAFNLVNYLNEAIRIAAAKAAVRYVDTSGAFSDSQNGRDYRLCGDQESLAVNGLVLRGATARKPGKLEYQESYHPNLLGHALLAATINTATNSLSLEMPAQPSLERLPSESSRTALVGDSDRHLGDGRPRYDISLIDEPSVRGERVAFEISGSWSDAKPGTPVTLELHSTPTRLGETTVGPNGEIAGTVTIPDAVEPGYHEFHVKYSNFFDEPIDQYQIIFVRASSDDYDGDGLLNDVDPCIIGDQSGVDKDQDGIDDACDYEYVKGDLDEQVDSRDDVVAKIIESITNVASYISETPGGEVHYSALPADQSDAQPVANDGQKETASIKGVTTSREERRINPYEWVSVAGTLTVISTIMLVGSRFIAKKLG